MPTHVVTKDAPLLEYLLKNYPDWKKTRVKQLLTHASVVVNGSVITSHKHLLQKGDKIEFLDKKIVAKRRLEQSLPFPIVYEDPAILVIDKPSGVAVHGGSGVSYGVIESLRAARPEAKMLELAHRLDRDTSGLLVVAKKRSALVELRLMTGRTHQIRVHLAHAGHPVLGDDKYGDFELNRALARQGVKRLFLHARRLELKHPIDGKAMKLESPLPDDMLRFCQANFGNVIG